jgi:hypothetical protein
LKQRWETDLPAPRRQHQRPGGPAER